MAKSKDVNELTHMWKQWHDETGRPLRSKFIRYVELSNEAARLNGKSHADHLLFALLKTVTDACPSAPSPQALRTLANNGGPPTTWRT